MSDQPGTVRVTAAEIRRAADLVGGARALHRRLGCNWTTLRRWMKDEGFPGPEHDRAIRAILDGEPPAPRA